MNLWVRTFEHRHLDNNLPDTFLMGWGTPRQHKLRRRVNKAQGGDGNKNRFLSCRWGGNDISELQRKWLLVSGAGAPLFALVPLAQGSHYQRAYWQIGEISVRSNKNDQGLL